MEEFAGGEGDNRKGDKVDGGRWGRSKYMGRSVAPETYNFEGGVVQIGIIEFSFHDRPN